MTDKRNGPVPVSDPNAAMLAGRTAHGTPTTEFWGEAGRPTPNRRMPVPHYETTGHEFGEETRSRAQQIIARYPHPRSALLPLLHLVQSEEGFLSRDGLLFCADLVGISEAEASGTATYYTMYKREPCGEHLVSVCTNTMCAALGGDAIFARLCDRLGVGHEQTAGEPGTPGSVTIEHVECLAACDLGPVVTVNYELFDKQTPDSAEELVAALQRGERPHPTRGAPLTSFKQAELQLAGFFGEPGEAYDAAVDAPSAAPESLRGVQLAADRGWTAPPMPSDPPPFPDPPEKK